MLALAQTGACVWGYVALISALLQCYKAAATGPSCARRRYEYLVLATTVMMMMLMNYHRSSPLVCDCFGFTEEEPLADDARCVSWDSLAQWCNQLATPHTDSKPERG